jgi:hypothetical protein
MGCGIGACCEPVSPLCPHACYSLLLGANDRKFLCERVIGGFASLHVHQSIHTQMVEAAIEAPTIEGVPSTALAPVDSDNRARLRCASRRSRNIGRAWAFPAWLRGSGPLFAERPERRMIHVVSGLRSHAQI